VPLELALFADAGVAWTSAQNDAPTFLGGDRKGVASYGAAARLNLFGAAVLELDYSRPLNLPGRGWLWQFQISPGGY
jgi:outer membrane protein assembly factor BamA